ncbi:MAG: NCS2 family permease [Clostridia bacterium]|nr:NCS2 family permease [Clostridia bacterium]
MLGFFKVKERGSTLRTEVFAGITTFMAMAYILMVNGSMFAELGISYNAIYIATAISAILGTVLMGLLANLPLAQASGMGINAFFVYTVCFGFGFTYANALLIVLIDGVIFIALTATGLRKKIFDCVPECVKKAIPIGIGMFIAFIGLQNSGLVVKNESTGVALASFNLLGGNVTWATIMPLLITIISLMVIAILSARKIKGAVLWGIIGGTVAYYLLGITVPGFYDGFADKLSLNPFTAFGDFANQCFGKVFTEGFDFSAYLANHSTESLIILIVTTSLAFCMVDMFDTMGTLYAACSQGNLLDEKGEVRNMNKAMLSDAVATTVGAVCGTSTVTTYVESTAGVAEGGRTGLSSLITAAMFFIAMFLTPVAALIPSTATAAALIFVGVLMMKSVKDIDWNDISVSVPAFLTIAMMPFTYNISYGIAFGLLAYVIIKLFTGKIKEIHITTWIITALFIAMFLLTH